MDGIMLGSNSLYQLFFYFFIYSFLGWIVEVIYAGVNSGKLVNRGFLTGPICPIYGVGAILIIELFTPIKNNYFLIFILSGLLTTSMELITGLILDYCFHKKWWDYSHVPFNFHGYICLKFSLIWSFACLFGFAVVQPAIYWLVSQIPVNIGIIWVIGMITVLVLDLVLVIIQVSNLNNKLNRLQKITEGVKLGKKALGDEIAERINILKKRNMNYTEWRIFKAFPNMISRNNKEAFEDLRNVANRKGEEHEK